MRHCWQLPVQAKVFRGVCAARTGWSLIYETFARGNERYGKPSNPDFLLEPGELLARCAQAGLVVIAYEDGVVLGSRRARVQRILAVEPSANLESFAIE